MLQFQKFSAMQEEKKYRPLLVLNNNKSRNSFATFLRPFDLLMRSLLR